MGYIADADGSFDWSEPDEEVHTFVNDLERGVGTHLYGRRMYEVMKVWESDEVLVDDSRLHARVRVDLALVGEDRLSTTLDAVLTARTRLERRFDPEDVRRMKAAAERTPAIAGPPSLPTPSEPGWWTKIHLFLSPVVVGGGTPGLPGGVSLRLELEDERRFGNGVVYLRHRVLGGPGRR